MYYIQSHSQQRHRGGLGILIPSILVLSFHSFQKWWSYRNSSLNSYNILTLVESLYCKGVLNMYYIQWHSQQRHHGGLGILIPSLSFEFRSFQKWWSCRNSSFISYNLFTHINLFCRCLACSSIVYVFLDGWSMWCVSVVFLAGQVLGNLYA